MNFTPQGKHLIAGEWQDSPDRFTSAPATGPEHSFSDAMPEQISQACAAAEDAFWSFSSSMAADRAKLLNTIADEIEARADAITEIGCQETGLPEARLQGERGRTTGQLRLFAEVIQSDDYLDKRHDVALPDRAPLPRPDLKMVQRPIGPVAVFGASNFPLAFSTAGGDTAAALAAGCPVVVKGHPAHPGTGEIIAQAIHAALLACDQHPGVFNFLHASTQEAGAALVQHPLICAVGFTGSLAGGRALFDLCAARPVPIPFFGELGSVNPMFLLPAAVSNRGVEIGTGWAASLTMGAGQFCTNPGVAIVPSEAQSFVGAALAALEQTEAQTMLTDGIASAYRAGISRLQEADGVTTLLGEACSGRQAKPRLYVVSAQDWMANPTLQEEVFGPAGIVVKTETTDEMLTIARALEGQLTCTIHMDEEDTGTAQSLMPILARKAGRLLVNGFPTGVEVSTAMVHGGPYPASTNFGATSVGTLAIRRFLRPVCYQNMPDALLAKAF